MSTASRLKGPMRRWLRQLLPRRSADHRFPPYVCFISLSCTIPSLLPHVLVFMFVVYAIDRRWTTLRFIVGLAGAAIAWLCLSV
jgi:hypothetical protein